MSEKRVFLIAHNSKQKKNTRENEHPAGSETFDRGGDIHFLNVFLAFSRFASVKMQFIYIL